MLITPTAAILIPIILLSDKKSLANTQTPLYRYLINTDNIFYKHRGIMITQGNSLDSYILNYSVKYHFMHHRLYSGYKH